MIDNPEVAYSLNIRRIGERTPVNAIFLLILIEFYRCFIAENKPN